MIKLSLERRILALTTIGMAVLLGFSFYQYQLLRAERSASNILSLQSNQARQDLVTCEQNYARYTRTATQQECHDYLDRSLSCAQNLRLCENRLLTVQDETSTSTRQYILDDGLTVVEQWSTRNDRNHLFWLSPQDKDVLEGPAEKSVIGTFPVLASPSGKSPVLIGRLTNGLYRLNVSADYTEAGEVHTFWINAAEKRFFGVGQLHPGDSLKIITPTINGTLSPRYAKKDCASGIGRATIDGILWNNELIYRLARPISVTCSFSELHGADVVEFLGSGDASVSSDLKTVTYPLVQEKKLRIQINNTSTSKPIVGIE